MKRTLLWMGAGAALCGMMASAWGAPIERKDLAPNPALLVHVDADALHATSVGKAILAEPDLQNKLDAVKAMFNFDLRSQLHGFSIYTTMDHAQDGVLIVYADFDQDRLITMAKVFSGFKADTNGSRVVYSWVEDKKKGGGDEPGRIFASVVGHRLIFGKTESILESALDVLDGKSPSLSDPKLLLGTKPGQLVVAEGAILKFDIENNNPGAAIFQASKAVRFQLGETDSKVGATVSFEAKDADSAKQVSDLVTGLLALLRIQNSKPELLKLANAINIKQDDSTVVLGLAVASSEVVDMIKKGQQEHAEKMEGHGDNEAKGDTNSPTSK